MYCVNFALAFLAIPWLSVARPGREASEPPRYLMYLTGQHPTPPSSSLLTHINHVALAFLPSSLFNQPNVTSYPLFTTVDQVRSQFAPDTKVIVAIGGWGDTAGFEEAARTEEGRERWAKNVKKMVEVTGADGVDVDWEYPGGNGEDYKIHPNPTKSWEITAYPLLLSTLRKHLPQPVLISAAVPGLPRDMLAFTSSALPSISESLDFFNLMTYDLMNRRDSVTKHHTGIELSLQAIDAYVDGGVAPGKLNLGFAFYVKWFKTSPNSTCATQPIGCPTVLMEDPTTGADLGQAGAFSYHDEVPKELKASWALAQKEGKYDEVGGGHYFHDNAENIWWSWDTAEAIERKFSSVVQSSGVGGVFAWGLGEDGNEFRHLEAMNLGMQSWGIGREGGRKCGTEVPENWFKDEL